MVIIQQPAHQSILLFPNPAADELNISFTGITKAEIRLFDLPGALRYSSAIEGQSARISLAGLASGIYIVEIADGKKSSRQKFVKL